MQSKGLIITIGIGVVMIGALLLARPDQPKKSKGLPSVAAESNGLTILPAMPSSNSELRVDTGVRATFGQTNNNAMHIWSVNGKEVHRGDALSPRYFRAGDTVRVEAPVEADEELRHASIVIPNSPPQINVVNVIRDRVDKTHLRALVGVQDADGDEVRLEYQWYVDGGRDRSERTDRYPVSKLERGSSVVCAVVAKDTESTTEPVDSNPFTLDNRAPALSIQTNAAITALADGGRQVKCHIAASDPDGDEVSVSFHPAPANLAWDAASGTASWTVAATALSTQFVVRVTDAQGATVEKELSLQL